MKLLTKEIIKKTPSIKSIRALSIKELFVTACFFSPTSDLTWYLIALDEDQDYGFGYVKGFVTELGFFSIKELESIKGFRGLGIERDRYFTPKLLTDIFNKTKGE